MPAREPGYTIGIVELSKIKRNKLFGRIAIFAAFVALFHAVEDASYGLTAAPLIDIGIAIVIFSCYLLYRSGYIESARIIGLAFLNITFAIYASVLPMETGIYFFYFPMIAISFAIYDSTEKKQRWFFISLSVFCLALLFSTDFKLLGDIQIEAADIQVWFLVNLFSSALVLIACMNFTIQLNTETEIHLHDLAREIKVQNVSLEKTNAELDRFLYSTSHDLRAPLMSIKGLVNIASNETTDKTLHKYFKMMTDRADKLDAFIKDIIDYSRNSRTELEYSAIDFDTLIDEVWDNFLFMEGASRIRLKKSISCEESYSDRSRLLVLLNNLVSNAIKYHNIDQLDPWISVSVVGSTRNLKIVITDNGLGIGKEHMARVFEMFYRAHEYSKGSGLGLYIVKEIINKLKGTIKVKSEEMEGTTFTIVIPVTSERSLRPPAAQVPSQPESMNYSLIEEAPTTTVMQVSR